MLTDEMRDALFDVACLMIKFGSRKRRVKSDDMEGSVTSSYAERAFAGLSGVEFFAEVETNLGRGKIKFLVRPVDLEKRALLEWSSFSTIEELLDHLAQRRVDERVTVH
jgi:hypothetical protein